MTNAVLIREGDPRWHTTQACSYVAGSEKGYAFAIDHSRLDGWIVTTSVRARTVHGKKRQCSGGLCKHLPYYDYREEDYL